MNDDLEHRLRQAMTQHDADIDDNPWAATDTTHGQPQVSVPPRRPTWTRAKLPVAAAIAVLVLLGGTISVIGTRSHDSAPDPKSSPPSTSRVPRTSSSGSAAPAQPWWSRPGPYIADQTRPIDCGVPPPNFTVLGPSKAGLTFNDQSTSGSTVTVHNRTSTVLEALATDSDVIFLDPNTLDVVGQGAMNMDVAEYQDLRPEQFLRIHFLGDPRDCSTPSSRLPEGIYPAYLRVQTHGTIGVYLIPVTATVTDRWATLSPPESVGSSAVTAVLPPDTARERGSPDPTPAASSSAADSPTTRPAVPFICHQPWAAPQPTASLNVQPVWTDTISISKTNTIRVRVTNTGATPVEGVGTDWLVLLLRDGKIISKMSDSSLVGHPRVQLAPGEGYRYAVRLVGAQTCTASYVEPLPRGAYQAVFVETVDSGYDYSEPVSITVVP